LSLGRMPISRHGLFNNMRGVGNGLPALSSQPKLVLFTSKAPGRFFEFFSKPCEQPCQNGGQCVGRNTCRCLHGFTGSMCQHKMQRRRKPTIVEIIGPAAPFFRPMVQQRRRPHLIKLPFFNIGQASDDQDNNNIMRAGRPHLIKLPFLPTMASDDGDNNIMKGGRPHLIKLPFLPTVASDDGDNSDNEDDESKQRTMGHVDQSKLVNILRKFTMPFSTINKDFGGGNNIEEENEGKIITLPFKRYNIPKRSYNTMRYNPYLHRNHYNRFY